MKYMFNKTDMKLNFTLKPPN